LLEVVLFREATVLVEVAEDGGVNGKEFLHRPFTSSKWQLRVLNSVDEPTTTCLPIVAADFQKRGFVGRASVCDQNLRPPVPTHQFPQYFQCGKLVSSLRNDTLQDLAFVIESSPEVLTFTIDFQEDPVDMPLPSREGTQLLYPTAPNLGCELRPKPTPPEADSFMADVKASLVQQILDVPERQRESDIQHHR
jgi:hypothetical protein